MLVLATAVGPNEIETITPCTLQQVFLDPFMLRLCRAEESLPLHRPGVERLGAGV